MLEAVVAMTIASVALAVIYRSVGIGLRSAARVQAMETAVIAARSRLDALAADGILTPGISNGTFEHGVKWRQTITSLSTSAAGELRPYWITLIALDASGAPLLKLETAKLAREPSP